METEEYNLIKTAIAIGVGYWCKKHDLGEYYTDGMLLSLPEQEATTQPDGMFVSEETRNGGDVTTKEQGRSKVLIGTPNMILEVISMSSKRKDKETLHQLYYEAGISEYWLVNSLSDEPALAIYKSTARGYVLVRPKSGWVKSSVFGCSFRLNYSRIGKRLKVNLERR